MAYGNLYETGRRRRGDRLRIHQRDGVTPDHTVHQMQPRLVGNC
jgi:hypothetical protein